MNFINSIAKNSNFAFFLRIFDEFFSGFRAKFQKRVTPFAFSIKFAKTNQKFAENFEFCEKNSLLFKIIHFTPYPSAGGRRRRARPALRTLPLKLEEARSLLYRSQIS